MASEDTMLWKWERFVELGNDIHKKRGQVRTILAEVGLILAAHIRRSEYCLLTEDHFILYTELVEKIAECLDGNIEVIQSAVREYFLVRHVKQGREQLEFEVDFAPKKSGVQRGFVCDVYNRTSKTRYFVKTHGPTADTIKSVDIPDAKELYVHKLLELIGIGPETHFVVPMHDTKRTVYIATKEAELVLLSALTTETANRTALLKLDLIPRILCLRDCTTNVSNCGQVGDKPMIIDFLIDMQAGGYKKSDLLDRFKDETSPFNYDGLMREATGASDQIKLNVVVEALREWNLPEKIDRAQADISALISKTGDKLSFTDDLALYVTDIKKTIEVLLENTIAKQLNQC